MGVPGETYMNDNDVRGCISSNTVHVCAYTTKNQMVIKCKGKKLQDPRVRMLR